jgi:hypothetical protein
MEELTVCSEESDRSTLRTSTTSTTNAMDVVLRVVWVIIVQHMSDVLDVFAKLKLAFRNNVLLSEGKYLCEDI